MRFNLHEHPWFPFLLAWRAILAAIALYAVSEKPFGSMLVALGLVGLLLTVGEGAYKGRVYLDEERRRKELNRQMREQRADEARLRFETQKAAQQAATNNYMSLGLEDDPAEETEPEVDPGCSGGMSSEDFDFALLDGHALPASNGRRLSASS